VTGRIVGIVIGPESDPSEIRTVQGALVDAGVLPLVVGPHGGQVGSIPVQRTYANAASIEFDAIIVAGDTPPAPDAIPSLDAKSAAEEGPATGIDPRVSKLIAEAWRHAKAIGTTSSAAAAASVLPANAPGIVHGEPARVAAQIVELLAAHRAWERFHTAEPA
jgi:catalase